MPLPPDTVVARAPGVLGEAVLGETVLLDPSADRYARLNRSAGLLWARLAEPATVADLGRELESRYELVPDRALADATALVSELERRGLVTVGPTS